MSCFFQNTFFCNNLSCISLSGFKAILAKPRTHGKDKDPRSGGRDDYRMDYDYEMSDGRGRHRSRDFDYGDLYGGGGYGGGGYGGGYGGSGYGGGYMEGSRAGPSSSYRQQAMPSALGVPPLSPLGGFEGERCF